MMRTPRDRLRCASGFARSEDMKGLIFLLQSTICAARPLNFSDLPTGVTKTLALSPRVRPSYRSGLPAFCITSCVRRAGLAHV
jgi:hypothetical protein